MEQLKNQERQISETEENYLALQFKVEFEKLNNALREYFISEWHRYIPDIDHVVEGDNYCVGFYYDNLDTYAPKYNCRIITQGTDEIISFDSTLDHDFTVKEYVIKRIKTELNQRTGDIQAYELSESAVSDFYGNIHGNNGLIAKEFTSSYIVVWGVPKTTKDDCVVDRILRKVMLDCVCELICSWDDLIGIIKRGSIDLVRLAEFRRFDFLNSYTKKLFADYLLPDEQIVRKISYLPYENRINAGTVVFLKRCEFDAFQNAIRFTGNDQMKFTDEWTVRKILEPCLDKYYLAVDIEGDHQILGYVESSDSKEQDNVRIEYEGVGTYKIFIAKEEVLRYARAEYYICKKRTDREVREPSGKIETGHKQIISDWGKQIKHGGLIIFIKSDIEDELRRLCDECGRGYRINNVPIKEFGKFVPCMAAVDGAILADYDGICYAYGVILDGEAKVKGNPRRGARFNSAMNYIYGKERTAVVISEDKEKPIYIIDGLELEQYPNLMFDSESNL